MLEIESIYEQASSFSKVNTSQGFSRLPSMGDDDQFRVPDVNLESLLAGSALFRQTILAMQVDQRLCSVMGTWVGRILGEDLTRQLLMGSEEKTVKQGALVWDPSLEPHLAIIISGQVSVTQELSTSSLAQKVAGGLSADETRPKNQILVAGDYIGAYAALDLGYLPGISAMATRQCTAVIVQNAHAKGIFATASKVRHELILQAGEAPMIPVEEVKTSNLMNPLQSGKHRPWIAHVLYELTAVRVWVRRWRIPPHHQLPAECPEAKG
eukprot:3736067-Rhodomonas_salina.1